MIYDKDKNPPNPTTWDDEFYRNGRTPPTESSDEVEDDSDSWIDRELERMGDN